MRWTMGRRGTKELDAAVTRMLGLPTLLLMEQAGLALWSTAQCMLAARGIALADAELVICCGSGGNGGDGFALARMALGTLRRVRCFNLATEEAAYDGDVRVQYEAAQRLGIEMHDLDALGEALAELSRAGGLERCLLVDAVYGIGYDVARPPAPRFVTYCEALARHPQLEVLACDLPSGIDADEGTVASLPETGQALAVRADVSLSFMFACTGLWSWPGRGHAGRIETAALGLPDEWLTAQLEAIGDPARAQVLDARRRPPPAPIPLDSHKGTQGRVLVAGSPGLHGAAILAALATQRAGAGLVRALTCPAQLPLLLAATPATMVHLWAEGREAALAQLEEACRAADAVLIGPGLGAGPRPGLDSLDLVAVALRTASQLILDADALNALARQPDGGRALLRQRREAGLAPAILTPHPGEFRRLCPEAEGSRLAQARAYARDADAVVLLKGVASVIASPDPDQAPYLNGTGNPSLARGGSGDLLAGLMLALAARHDRPEEAAALAAWLHGRAADLAAAAQGTRGADAAAWLAALDRAWPDVAHTPSATTTTKESSDA